LKTNHIIIKGLFACLSFLALFNLATFAQKVPGTVVAFKESSSKSYVGSPSLCVLPNGSYLASHDFFGKQTPENQSVIYRSDDKGKTWKQIAQLQQFWSELFVHHNAVYFIGPIKANGDFVIRKSIDGGYTWTNPTDEQNGLILKGKYHCAPTPVVAHNGRLWRALEDSSTPKKWPMLYQTMVISIPTNVNLLEAKNWTATNRLEHDSTALNQQFLGWLEGNIVIGPNKEVLNVLRVHTLDQHKEYAAIAHVSADGKNITFNPEQDFINMPGGSKKFTIKYDQKSGKYWSLVNYVPAPYQGIMQLDRIRNTLALVSSSNLKDWTINHIVLQHEDYKHHGFQYINWFIDGNDIIALSRTAFNDGVSGAADYHNSNYMTFHRIKKFRKLK